MVSATGMTIRFTKEEWLEAQKKTPDKIIQGRNESELSRELKQIRTILQIGTGIDISSLLSDSDDKVKP